MSGHRCSRCTAALVTPEQYDRGLCANCLTSASLSGLVALAVGAAQTEPDRPKPYAFNGKTYTAKIVIASLAMFALTGCALKLPGTENPTVEVARIIAAAQTEAIKAITAAMSKADSAACEVR